MEAPVQVLSTGGDGGAIAIRLRALLHTIHRRARVTITVLVNEVFANTGFQYSPAATPFAETSTTPTGSESSGNLQPPLDYIHLAIAAGAEYVAQVSPAHGKLFVKVVERALASQGTAVVFVPAPCITGWKFDDGRTIELALLGARSGVFPAFLWERGKGGSVKDCERDATARPRVTEFLGAQRRFQHLVEKDPERGGYRTRAGREPEMARLESGCRGTSSGSTGWPSSASPPRNASAPAEDCRGAWRVVRRLKWVRPKGRLCQGDRRLEIGR